MSQARNKNKLFSNLPCSHRVILKVALRLRLFWNCFTSFPYKSRHGGHSVFNKDQQYIDSVASKVIISYNSMQSCSNNEVVA